MNEASTSRRLATALFVAALTLGVPLGPDSQPSAHAAEIKKDCPPGLPPQLIGSRRWIQINPALLEKTELTLDQAINQSIACRSDDEATTFQLDPGKYPYGKSIMLDSNVSVSGAGIGKTELEFKPTGDDSKAFGVPSKGGPFENILIEDLSLKGPGTTEKEIDGFQFRNTIRSKISQVAVSLFSRDGFHFYFQKDKGVDDSTISDCSASENGRNGISITSGARNVIERCKVFLNNLSRPGDYGVAGISLEPDSSNKVVGTIVRNNEVRNNGWNGIGTAIENPEEGELSDNRICGNQLFGNRALPISGTGKNLRNPGRPNIFSNNSHQPQPKEVHPGSIITAEWHPDCGPKTNSSFSPWIPVTPHIDASHRN